MSELDRLDPEPKIVKLGSGFSIEIMRLKTRQLFRLLKIMTHGAGPAMMEAQLDFSADPAQFGAKLLALVLFSIPDAETEFIQFIGSMARPHGLVEKNSKLNKQELGDNQALWDTFSDELNNPEPMDLLDVVEAIIEVEGPELQALGKRLAALVKTLQKTGADKEKAETPPTPQELNSPENSPESSIS